DLFTSDKGPFAPSRSKLQVVDVLASDVQHLAQIRGLLRRIRERSRERNLLQRRKHLSGLSQNGLALFAGNVLNESPSCVFLCALCIHDKSNIVGFRCSVLTL